MTKETVFIGRGKEDFHHPKRRFYNNINVKKWLLLIAVYSIVLFYSFPIIYMFLTAFKSEYNVAPPSIFFHPTLDTFLGVLKSKGLLVALGNSLLITGVSTIICLIFGVGAAYAIAFGKFKKDSTPNGIYFWFITTVILPPAAIIIPLTNIFKFTGIFGTNLGLIIIYTGFHIPLVVWMVRSFFIDIPKDIIEASEIDGSSKLMSFFKVILPLSKSGIMSATLLVFIFIWNEFFLALNLGGPDSVTLSVYMSRFSSQMGLYYAQLSASGTLVVLPVIILGWISQKSLVQGLSMGAVKG